MQHRSKVGAVVLIVLGSLFLLSNLGWIPNLHDVLKQWWPLLLIGLGIGKLYFKGDCKQHVVTSSRQ